MDSKFLDSSIDKENIVLPDSDSINPFLKRNNYAEIIKAVDFLTSEEKLLYIHGFLGTGKRQFVNYLKNFFNKDVVTLEYYCKKSTVCDDILLHFIDTIEKQNHTRNNSINAKITTLAVKFQQNISLSKRNCIIILHSYDDIDKDNLNLIKACLEKVVQNDNVKIILSTRAMLTDFTNNNIPFRKILLKALSKEIFKDFLSFNNIIITDTTIEDFYKYTRGYYYYTALSIKIVKAMKVTLNEFLEKFSLSGKSFDEYLGTAYINLIPNTIRNFFWFLRSLRHGISLNALAIYELYDEFSIEYLKANLMIFQFDEVLYVHDYFQQDIDLQIPPKTEIKLHKYIIGIYEKELKSQLQNRSIYISRQAMRAEIEYHNSRIKEIEEGKSSVSEHKNNTIEPENNQPVEDKESFSDISQLEKEMLNAKKLAEDKNYTGAIEGYLKIIDTNELNSQTLVEIRIRLGALYKQIFDYKKSEHYYELAETYYKHNNEAINLNYLYYELASLYYDMYKIDRSIETLKKVIYSVDTPASLMVKACIKLANIYSERKNIEEADKYYSKALESIDTDVEPEALAELYFKYAILCEDMDNQEKAFEYYDKCIALNTDTPYKALSYSNIASCYYENENFSDAKICFKNAYDIEKSKNNFEGIYYNSLYLGKIYEQEGNSEALNYYIEAKQSAEFINQTFYVIEASIALGDYFYNDINMHKKALIEYLKAKQLAISDNLSIDLNKIDARIQDMKMRMDEEEFNETVKKYG